MALAPESLLSPGRQALNLLAEGLRPLLAKRWLPPAVNLTALVILVAILADGIWMLFKPAAPDTGAGAAPVSSRVENFELQPLLAAHLFGRSARGAGGSLESIPLSSLNLVLVGVIAPGYALISVDGRPQEPYALGQEITAGAVLRAVYADRVIIERGGVTESLMLQETVKALQGVTGAVGAPVPPVASAPTPVAGVQEVSKNQYQVARDQVHAQMRSPELLTQARLLPHPSGGFLVREIKAGGIYEKLGLQVGDVIRSLNGAPVNSAEDALKFYQQLSSLNQIRLEIIRGGRVEQLSYNLQ
jgi:general secretion pathway protein C